jgi:hypothetical protein
MVDPKSTNQKAKELLKSMHSNYDDTGNMTLPYFEELEKGLFENRRKKLMGQQPSQPPPTVDSTPPVAPVTPPAELPKQPEAVSQIKLPDEVKVVPADAMHQAAAQVKPPAPDSEFPEELYQYAQQHPGLKGYVQRFDKNGLLNYANARIARMVKEGNINNELDMDIAQRMLKRLNRSKTPDEFFEAMYELSGTVLSPEAAPPTDVRSGKVVSSSKFVSTDAFIHLRNSLNAHLPMNEEIKNDIKKVVHRQISPEMRGTPIHVAVEDALDKNIGKPLKEVGIAIGQAIAPMIGKLDDKISNLPPEEAILRDQALKIAERLRNVLGVQTFISNVNLGNGAFKMRGRLGLPMDENDKKKWEFSRQTVSKSMDEFGDPIYDDNEISDYVVIERKGE